MNKEKVSISTIFFTFLVVCFVIYMCITFEPIERKVNKYYQVYLSDKKVGLISSKDDLYDLIDKEQDEIKKKYGVSKIYPPEGLEVQEVLTYDDDVMTPKEVYNEIKDSAPFTIEGYEVSVKGNDEEDSRKFYILNKKDLDVAVKNTILAFLSEEEYNNYLSGKYSNSKEEGMEITNIYFDQNVTIKKTYVSTEEKIITNSDELSQYFLFGTTNLTDKYTVKDNDTIETIAYNNKLGVSDFLIANPDIVGENALLAEGQEVTVSPISPIANIVVESFDTELQTIKHETKVEYDKSLSADDMYVKQNGSDGLSKVTFATKEMNGVILKSAQVSNEVISEAVDKIIVVGAKNVVYYGNTTYWAWPTSKPFRISSYYGYRVHPIRGEEHFHSGVDITGTSSRNVYAIQSGTVKSAQTGWNSGAGTNVKIDHDGGYMSVYMHLSKYMVKPGDKVEKGQVIGIMGCTGSCTGTHLHLTIYKNGVMMDPLKLYK